MTKTCAVRFHDISVGHTVTNHESKCAHLHGHNYRIHFRIGDGGKGLDNIGRVLDFGVIKSKFCAWLEENWDHKFLVWREDSRSFALRVMDPDGVVLVPFNPTAENMAEYLLMVVGPGLLFAEDPVLEWVKIEETYKCSVETSL